MTRTRRSLRLAGFSYFDRTGAIEARAVELPGYDVEYVVLDSAELGRRLYRNAEFDGGELWAASHVCDVARGTSPYVGIPVFPSRTFRHGFIYIRDDRGIAGPSDLTGRRVGVVEYVQTAAVWARAALAEQYGVDLRSIEWVETARRTHAAIDTPRGFRTVRIDDDRSLEDLLLDGVVDAAIGALDPRRFDGTAVRRLFPDHRAEERAYYARTGVLPIMHIVGIRRDVHESDPSLAPALVRFFEEAKQVGARRLGHVSAPAVALPWLADHIEETRAVLGPDPFPYGLEPNQVALEHLTRHVHDQGLTPSRVPVESLFAGTLEASEPTEPAVALEAAQSLEMPA